MIRLETLILLAFLNSSFRTQISQFELFEPIPLLILDKQFPVERFEAVVPQSAVPSPPIIINSIIISSIISIIISSIISSY